MMQDFLFFLGIVLAIFAVWVGSGGPDRPISFAGPFLTPISSPTEGANPYGDPNAFSPIGSDGNTGSAYRGKVSLSRDVSGAMSADPKNEYVVIRLSGAVTEGVSLVGWKLASSASNNQATLPNASELPSSGRVSATGPVTLSPGEEAIVVTGRSPVGVSFKENRCTGYFEERQNFSPTLSLACPTPGEEFSNYYDDSDDDECEFYVRGMPRCETETKVPDNLSSSCEAFIDEYLNYNGCIAAHKVENGFYTGTWRLFLGKSDELWRKSRETILLIDPAGQTVDALSY